MEELRLDVRLRGSLRKYFEAQKDRLGLGKDSKALRAIIEEHRKVMEMKYVIVWFLLLFSSCMQPERILTKSTIPDEVQPFYDSFFYEAELRGVYIENAHVEILIVDELDAGGRTIRNKKQILLPKYLFDWGHEDNRINTEYNIFHEFGHYFLGIGHINELDENGTPVSMMHYHKRAYTVGKEYLRGHFLDQLFLED